MSRKPRVELAEISSIPSEERAAVKKALTKGGFAPRRVPEWTFRVMGVDDRRVVVPGDTWHVARANAASVLQVDPGELALVEGGR